MSNLTVLAPDNYVTCPYDLTHRILWHRLPLHLVKCRKQHQFVPLQPCPFDTKHLVPHQEMHFHMIMCDAKVILESDITHYAVQEKNLRDESQSHCQVPKSPLADSVKEEPAKYVPIRNRIRRKLPKQLNMDTQFDTISQDEKEEMWDEDVHRSGIVVQPFKFGESSVNPSFAECRSYSLGGNVIPLRQPLNVVQITDSREARNPIVYSYAMNSVGIGRGAGRGRNLTSGESCDSKLSISRISSLGVGRARGKVFPWERRENLGWETFRTQNLADLYPTILIWAFFFLDCMRFISKVVPVRNPKKPIFAIFFNFIYKMDN